jgi:hypothetical protein
MRKLLGGVIAAALVTTSSAAVAGPTLLAMGTLSDLKDKSGLDYTLENGLSAAVLGGIGSGLTYAGGTTFLAVPDRGPNATVYDPLIDNTTSYISRVQTLNLALTASNGALPFTLTPTLTGTTLLYSPTALNYGSGNGLGVGSGAPPVNTSSKFYFTGRSDNYGSGGSGNQADARFDPEAIRISNDGKSVFISDEYGPYIRQFDRQTGQLIKSFTLPSKYYVPNKYPTGDVNPAAGITTGEIPDNTIGRVANKGMEGLAITPDGKTLFGIVQAAMEQDKKGFLRIVKIDIASGNVTGEYGYNLTTGSGVSDLVAIDSTHLLVDERDGNGLGNGNAAAVKQFFAIDLAGATDVSNLTGNAAKAAAVAKPALPFLDLVSALTAAGVPATQIPAKIEGITFGQDVTVNGVVTHTLFVADDNDFVPDVAGPNHYFVFGFTDSDLPNFVAQAIAPVPEPGTWAMMLAGFAAVGTALRRRGKARAGFVRN